MQPLRIMMMALLAAAPTVWALPIQAARLDLLLAGEAYQGAPEYEILADGVAVGQGAVDNAVESPLGSLSARELAATARAVAIEVPDGAVTIGLRFLNDAWGGEGTSFDRNLYLLAASVDGAAVPFAAMQFEREGVVSDPQLVLLSVPLVQTDDAVFFDMPPAERRVAAPACAPVPPLVVDDFEINSTSLSPAALAALKTLADAIEGPCKITVTGFVSRNGPVTWNRTLAEQRAQVIRAALSQHLPQGTEITAAPGTLADTALRPEDIKADRVAVIEVSPTEL